MPSSSTSIDSCTSSSEASSCKEAENVSLGRVRLREEECRLFDAETQVEWNFVAQKWGLRHDDFVTSITKARAGGVHEVRVNEESQQAWFQRCADAEYESQERERKVELSKKECLFKRRRLPRIGERYQVHDLPGSNKNGETATYTTNRSGGELFWSPLHVTTHEVWAWLETQGPKLPLALKAMHEAKYSMEQAKEWFHHQTNNVGTGTQRNASSHVLEWHTRDNAATSPNTNQPNDTWENFPRIDSYVLATQAHVKTQAPGAFEVQECKLSSI